MVKQKIILIGPEDVARIRLRCTTCQSELVFELLAHRPFPGRYADCRAEWKPRRNQED